jgi:hypothetical protein
MRFTSRWPIVFALIASGASLPAQYPGALPPPVEYRKGFDSIRIEDVKKWLQYLAGPECQGRGTGQPGFQKAADFVAARFKEWGLKPIGDGGSYFQSILFTRSKGDPAASSVTVEGTDVKVSGERSLGFINLSADADLSAEAVFVYAVGADVRLEDPSSLEGKVVVLLDKTTGNAFRSQLFRARPAAILTVTDQPTSSWRVRRQSGQAPQNTGAIRLSVTPSEATRLAGACSITAPWEGTNGVNGVTVRTTGTKLKVVAKVHTETVSVPNVVGMIEGSDPVLKSEAVGLGAHLDHLGESNGTIYYGADDDGSGTTAMLAIAHAISVSKVKPKRSIVFMAFCGEEMGLIGSGHYAENPVIPLDKQICHLQMDMVGRNEENGEEKASDNEDTIHLVGSKRISTELHDLVLKANEHIKFQFEYDEEDVYTRSDHYQFARKGVPVAFLFSGFHPDYHQATDTVEKINFRKIVSTARLFYLVALMAANRDKPFAKDGSGG